MLIRAHAGALPLQDGCVQTVVTSPPYWGLRCYDGAMMTWPDAWCGALGLEPTYDQYVAHLVGVCAEIWRVLRDDGTLWLNLGDCYYSGDRGGYRLDSHRRENSPMQAARRHKGGSGIPLAPNQLHQEGLKDKDLLGIPWRVAFALQAAGWYLRSDIIWHKSASMPESVRDRPTRAHEYVFLLAKQPSYYYDAAAIAEPVSAAMLAEVEQEYAGLGLKDYEGAGVQNPSSLKRRIIANARRKNERSGDRREVGFNDRWDNQRRLIEQDARSRHDVAIGLTRNARTVWTIPTQPFLGAHFAVFPEALAQKCVLAGSRMGDLVLDPFVGSGTTVRVAERFGRRAIGVDLGYQDLAREQTAQRGLRFDAAGHALGQKDQAV